MPWSSTVPAAIDGIVGAFTDNATLAGLVLDGPTLKDTGKNEAVFVGYQGDDADTVADGRFSSAGLAVEPDREQYSVQCAVVVLNGSGTVPAARARTYELFTACISALAANHTLGSAVMSASPGAWSLSMQQTNEGLVATLTFNVDIDAYTQL